MDVRNISEYQTKHIEGAINIPLSSLQDECQKINTESYIYVHCAAGYRSVIAISLLNKIKYLKPINILGGFNEILKCNLNENCYNSNKELNRNNI